MRTIHLTRDFVPVAGAYHGGMTDMVRAIKVVKRSDDAYIHLVLAFFEEPRQIDFQRLPADDPGFLPIDQDFSHRAMKFVQRQKVVP